MERKVDARQKPTRRKTGRYSNGMNSTFTSLPK